MKGKKVIIGLLAALLLAFFPGVNIPEALAQTPVSTENEGATKLARVAVKTNLLYDAAALPSVGVELRLGAGWTLMADWTYAWWRVDKWNFSHQAYGGYAGVRKYFGKQTRTRAFTGHHIGAYASALTYDFEYGKRGYQAARWGFGGGLEYGYSFPIGKCLNLDISLGVGYQDGEYKTYNPQDGHFVWQGTYIRQWVGPTKAEVSLVWLLGGQKNNKEHRK